MFDVVRDKLLNDVFSSDLVTLMHGIFYGTFFQQVGDSHVLLRCIFLQLILAATPHRSNEVFKGV
jgi:hypothetical protein